jgi:prepilin-type N-terminal cleavage/methylation domain-containing protein
MKSRTSDMSRAVVPRGFTLIELLVVIAIIAILAALAAAGAGVGQAEGKTGAMPEQFSPDYPLPATSTRTITTIIFRFARLEIIITLPPAT